MRLDGRAEDGLTPFGKAVQGGHATIAAALLSAGAVALPRWVGPVHVMPSRARALTDALRLWAALTRSGPRKMPHRGTPGGFSRNFTTARVVYLLLPPVRSRPGQQSPRALLQCAVEMLCHLSCACMR